MDVFLSYESHLIVMKRLQSITNENSDRIKRVDSFGLVNFQFSSWRHDAHESGNDLFHIENTRSATFVPFDGC
jgi:hypothetical protein